jgi:predicted transcriptional regulator
MVTIDQDANAKVMALLGEGLAQNQIAERLGVSPSTVSRVVAEHRWDGEFRPAQDAVDVFVASLGDELAPDVAARVEALRSLAAKLDWARQATTGTAAMASASIAKEYRSLLDELRQVRSFDALRQALLAPDGT